MSKKVLPKVSIVVSVTKGKPTTYLTTNGNVTPHIAIAAFQQYLLDEGINQTIDPSLLFRGNDGKHRIPVVISSS